MQEPFPEIQANKNYKSSVARHLSTHMYCASIKYKCKLWRIYHL